ncbi:hypothetical protein D3C71_2189300 [compost metagenome]
MLHNIRLQLNLIRNNMFRLVLIRSLGNQHLYRFRAVYIIHFHLVQALDNNLSC